MRERRRDVSKHLFRSRFNDLDPGTCLSVGPATTLDKHRHLRIEIATTRSLLPMFEHGYVHTMQAHAFTRGGIDRGNST
jgi:hypothetical protein